MFKRISKAQARKRYAAGLYIILCPAHMRPGFPFAPQSYVHPDGRDFDTRYNEWAYYNASSEAGRYAHFYVEES